ncbi:MAG: hypothetical protein M3O33_08655 [Cyanobacteriota bacterium]|nr:hypothetical protein [Cyanobacteriota bacterium]
MAKFCLLLSSASTLALLTLAAGCSSISLPNITPYKTSSTTSGFAIRPVVSAQLPQNCANVDLFARAIEKAQSAATLAQTARSQKDWDLVTSQWIQAIAAMQAVPPDDPRRAYAQKKVAEYLQNLVVARQKASTLNSQLPFASFDNQIFDEQLRLYLSYVAAFGPPDVLIVGSSRALVGVEPRQLQQALAAQGKRGLRVFNLGVNGGTAQIVDLQLRQLLTPNKLPRLILWADGVRAFNSGRVDKTYNSLLASAGYQRLKLGNRPTLPEAKPQITNACEDIPCSAPSSATKKQAIASFGSTTSTTTSDRWQLAQASFETTSNPVSSPADPLLLSQRTGASVLQRLTTSYSSSAIDANGFLPIDSRFDPNIYYQKTPRVTGQYDSDYQPFSLSGSQAVALNSVKAFARQQKIPLVFVNLPLTDDYLDSVRQSREQQFQRSMQGQVGNGFMFIDLRSQWPNQYQYFTDPSHLNRNGAAAVSNLLAVNRQIPWPQARP